VNVNTAASENVYGHRKKLDYIKRTIVSFAGQDISRLKVLDFGCGNGTAVSFELASLGVDLTGFDFHHPSIEYARMHGPANAEFICGTLEDLKTTFDVIVCADVIEHLPQPKQILQYLRRLHRTGGILIAVVPNGVGPFELENKLPKYLDTPQLAGYILDIFFKSRRRLFGIPPPPDPGLAFADIPYNAESGHVQFFRLKDIRTLAAEGGYRIVEAKSGIFLGSPAFSAHFMQYSKRLIRWNTVVADHLPLRFVSTWYFTWEAV